MSIVRCLVAGIAIWPIFVTPARGADVSRPTTFIRELPHPRVVAHYHPRAGMQFLLWHARFALNHNAHALELDLHMRGNDVICNHDGPTPQSPRLRDVIQEIVQFQGQKASVHGDDRQFFLVLEPKDNNPALFQQVFDILGENLAHLSTAVRPGDSPRGLTVVITGAWLHQFRAQFADRIPDLDRRCILENHDYTTEIQNLSDNEIPFQWTAIQHPGEYGRVNALHSGADRQLAGRYNIRVWGAGRYIHDAFFSGADSINCDHEQLVPFENFVRHEEASGRHPSLAVNGRRALLAWRGASSNNLYISLGTADADGLAFPRQLNLTAFLTDQPQGFGPAAAILPDGRILVVYEGTADRRLWHICGKLTGPDRFLTFSGSRRLLSAPDGSARSGTQPAVAVAPDGRVVIVYRGPDRPGLRYVAADVGASGELIGDEHALTIGSAADGDSPSISINAKGQVLLAYRETVSGRIHAIAGALDDSGVISGTDTAISDGGGVFAADPTAALDGGGDARIMWTVGGKALHGFRGVLASDNRLTGKPFAWQQAGTDLSSAFVTPGMPLVVYAVPGAFRVHNMNLDPRATPDTLDVGMDPR